MSDETLNMKDSLGLRLKASREEAGLSQTEVAAIVGISQPSLSDLESGITKRSKYIVELANIYGVDPVWLATGKGQQIRRDSVKGFELLNNANKAAVENMVSHLLDAQAEKR